MLGYHIRDDLAGLYAGAVSEQGVVVTGNMPYADRTSVITGATGVLGRALARHMAAGGARVGLLGRDLAALQEVAATLGVPEGRIACQAAELLDPDAAHAAADAIGRKFGQIDILAHVVGGWVGGTALVETRREDLELMLNQHVWTSFNVLQAFVPHMLRNRWGRIVMITSPAGARPGAKGSAYAAGKAGQEALMLALSQELKGTGVTANVLQVRAIDEKPKKSGAPSGEAASWTTPDQIAFAVSYLCSDAGGTVNGAKIPMFGAYS